jgi:hypothetical protein
VNSLHVERRRCGTAAGLVDDVAQGGARELAGIYLYRRYKYGLWHYTSFLEMRRRATYHCIINIKKMFSVQVAIHPQNVPKIPRLIYT